MSDTLNAFVPQIFSQTVHTREGGALPITSGSCKQVRANDSLTHLRNSVGRGASSTVVFRMIPHQVAHIELVVRAQPYAGSSKSQSDARKREHARPGKPRDSGSTKGPTLNQTLTTGAGLS